MRNEGEFCISSLKCWPSAGRMAFHPIGVSDRLKPLSPSSKTLQITRRCDCSVIRWTFAVVRRAFKVSFALRTCYVLSVGVSFFFSVPAQICVSFLAWRMFGSDDVLPGNMRQADRGRFRARVRCVAR